MLIGDLFSRLNEDFFEVSYAKMTVNIITFALYFLPQFLNFQIQTFRRHNVEAYSWLNRLLFLLLLLFQSKILHETDRFTNKLLQNVIFADDDCD